MSPLPQTPHYDVQEDPFLHERCFTDRGDGKACLHLLVQHSSEGCPWCPCGSWTALADALADGAA